MARGEILVLSCHPGVASYRHRMASLFDDLSTAGWKVTQALFRERLYVARSLLLRSRLRAADVVVLQKIKVSPPEARLIRRFSRRAVLDIDDAVYLRKPRYAGGPAEDARWRRRKFAATCRAVDVVVAGNRELAAEAARYARRVEVVPTAVDLEHYRRSVPDSTRPPTLVWVGRPENLKSLELVRPALAAAARRVPGLRLRVVCSSFPEWPEVAIERVEWSPESEVDALETADVGLMPLADDAWSRGKCAFKLLQYMAASLPCVASPVGANREAVLEGVTGFLPADEAAWEGAVVQLLGDADARCRLGAAGREHAERRYSIAGYRAHYLSLVREVTAG